MAESPVKKLENHGLLTIIGISPVPVSDPIADGGGGDPLADFWLHINKKILRLQKRITKTIILNGTDWHLPFGILISITN